LKLFHLSHTDLDGYACQLITSQLFKDTFFLNANYGLEVKLSIKRILEEISLNKEEEIFFLITDLNLTFQESRNLDKAIKELKENGFNITLQLLDHHATGQKSYESFDWYYLDTARCATKIVYDFFDKKNSLKEEIKKWLSPLVDCVNAIDIWLENQKEDFEFGKVLLSMISKVREVNNILFPNLNREFRIYLLRKASSYIKEKNGNIKLDNDVHRLKKAFLILDGIDDTLDNLSAKYLVNSIEGLKNKLTITYKDHKGILTYTLGSISIPANAFLKANNDYDFFIDIGKKGNTSLRASGKVDVSYIASKLANGGGHINASGCKFDDFRETINYEEVRRFIQNKLDTLD